MATMLPRALLWILLVLACFGAPATCPAVEPDAAFQRPPNIIFLLTDDQRYDALGAMGNPIIQTPHLDRLANQGTLFTHAFVTTSICSISRANFITGQHARRHGIHDFATPLTVEQLDESFPVRLRAAGYRTCFIGKWGLGGPLPLDAYDDWYGFSGQGSYFEAEGGEHLTDRQGADALRFLRDCSPEVPFCLQISFKAAHCDEGNTSDFTPATRLLDRYRDVEIPLPLLASAQAHAALPDFLQDGEARARWVGRFSTPERYQKTVKDYYRLITGVDEVVGQLVETLAQRGLADNTVIVFTSDNGFYLGERGLAGKWFMHEESIRVPLFVFDPRLPCDRRGQKRDEMVLSIDLAPTFLELAGLAIPASLQGRSLVPLVAGESADDWRDAWYYEHPFNHPRIPVSEGVRTARWKYVRYPQQEPPYEELFDLHRDPDEQCNLAADPAFAERLDELRALWGQLRDQAQ